MTSAGLSSGGVAIEWQGVRLVRSSADVGKGAALFSVEQDRMDHRQVNVPGDSGRSMRNGRKPQEQGGLDLDKRLESELTKLRELAACSPGTFAMPQATVDELKALGYLGEGAEPNQAAGWYPFGLPREEL